MEEVNEPIDSRASEQNVISPPDVLPSASPVQRVVADLHTYGHVEEFTTAAYATRLDASAAEIRLRQIDTAVERIHRTADAFDAKLATVYSDPPPSA